jgi:hypothetical protein
MSALIAVIGSVMSFPALFMALPRLVDQVDCIDIRPRRFEMDRGGSRLKARCDLAESSSTRGRLRGGGSMAEDQRDGADDDDGRPEEADSVQSPTDDALPDSAIAEASAEAGDEDDRLVQRIVEKISPDSRLTKIELFTTVILAVAGVLTAWTALQSAKWSGEQAIHFSEAGAARTESTRFDNRASSLILLDTSTFFQWGQALQSERLAAAAQGTTAPDPTVFDPDDPSLSGYFFSLFRDDFQPRVVTWLDGGGPVNPAGASPFDPFEEYAAQSVPPVAEAARLAAAAEESAALARDDNQNSDNYVVTVVILAAVLFFAGVSSKMKSRINQNLMFFLALGMLAWAIARLATLPIHAVP